MFTHKNNQHFILLRYYFLDFCIYARGAGFLESVPLRLMKKAFCLLCLSCQNKRTFKDWFEFLGCEYAMKLARSCVRISFVARLHFYHVISPVFSRWPFRTILIFYPLTLKLSSRILVSASTVDRKCWFRFTQQTGLAFGIVNWGMLLGSKSSASNRLTPLDWEHLYLSETIVPILWISHILCLSITWTSKKT